MTRTCGSCHECCVHVKVEALNKPPDTPCPHLTVLNPCGACGIYAKRPSECKAYTCSWLDGYLPEELKPETSGILLELATVKLHNYDLKMLVGFEHAAGAIDKYYKQLEAAAVNGVIILIVSLDRGAVGFFGQPGDLRRYLQWARDARRAGVITHRFADGIVEQPIGDD